MYAESATDPRSWPPLSSRALCMYAESATDPRSSRSGGGEGAHPQAVDQAAPQAAVVCRRSLQQDLLIPGHTAERCSFATQGHVALEPSVS